MSARCRDALRTGKHQELINLIQDMPFAQSAVATLVLHRLRAANDTAAALPICGLLFPAAVIDLLNRLALEYKVDVFEFAPIRDDAGRIIRPMRRMMDRFHHETAFDRQEDTFRALFWTRGAISEIIKDDDRLPTLLSRGWSYRAVSREDREVPGWKKFGEMIDTISGHFPGKATEFERLRSRFWQVCLYENLLSTSEDISSRVPEFDPMIVFAHAGSMSALPR